MTDLLHNLVIGKTDEHQLSLLRCQYSRFTPPRYSLFTLKADSAQTILAAFTFFKHGPILAVAHDDKIEQNFFKPPRPSMTTATISR